MTTQLKHRGMMIIVSSPSGAGKTTLTRMLLDDPHINLSISVTTRPPRPSEKDGVDYHFKTLEEFNTLKEERAFLEYAHVFDHYYGTPKNAVQNALEKGLDVLFDIDWQGTQQLAQQEPEDVIKVFILPPSLEALDERLHNRAEDSKEIIARRMEEASREISHWAEYDYVIINSALEDSFYKLKSIIQAERLKRRRQIGLSDFVKTLSCQ
jgi:guanylate kinase